MYLYLTGLSKKKQKEGNKVEKIAASDWIYVGDFRFIGPSGR